MKHHSTAPYLPRGKKTFNKDEADKWIITQVLEASAVNQNQFVFCNKFLFKTFKCIFKLNSLSLIKLYNK